MKDEFSIEGVNDLLDAVMSHLGLRNDAALARKLEVAPPVISKLRHGRLPVGPTLLIRIHEETGLAVRHMKRILAKQAA